MAAPLAEPLVALAMGTIAVDRLDAIAEAAAGAAGGAIAIVLPAVGAALSSSCRDDRLREVRQFVVARLAGQPSALPHGFVTDAPIGSDHTCIGAVVLLDDGRTPTPCAEAILRLTAVAALGAVDTQHDGAGGRSRAADRLLADLCAGTIDTETLVERARRLGCDLTLGAIAVRSSAGPEGPSRVATAIATDFPCALVARRRSEIQALVPGDSASAHEQTQRLVARLQRYASIGLSAHEPSPAALHRALNEADVALALVRAGHATPAEAATGTWHLLVHLAISDLSRLRRVRDSSVGPALAHDATHGTELVRTLATYVACGANMNATAAALPAHRHTVAYRLRRLATITGLDATRPRDDRERLALGLKAQHVLAAMGESRSIDRG
jgi:hypothetical protein